MNTLNPRRLTPEEDAVLDAIFAQCGLCVRGNIFRYDLVQAQKMFIENGAFVEHQITYAKQIEILWRLAEDHIVSFDSILDRDFINTLDPIRYPNVVHINSEQRFFWARQTNWAYEEFQLNGHRSIEEVYSIHKNSIFINMSTEDISNIVNNYRATHVAQLDLYKDRLCLRIKFDQEKIWKQLPPFRERSVPFRVICYAYENANRLIRRNELTKNGNIDLRGRYLKSQVFSDNNTVLSLSPLLLKLDKDSIGFITKPVKITLAGLNKLKSDLKII